MAFHISNSGLVVGHAYFSGHAHAALWDDGVLRDLHPVDWGISFAYGINDAGQVVGSTDTPEGNHAFIWDQGTMTYLESVSDYVSANAINSAGQVVGWAGGMGVAPHAVLWQDGSMIDLGASGENASAAEDINTSGQVAGWIMVRISTHDLADHACYWAGTQMCDLGTLGGKNSRARAVNDVGQIVGWAETPAGNQHAFIWDSTGGIRELSELGDVDTSRAFGINKAGQVVGEWYPGGKNRAFFWENGQMTDLNDLIPEGTGWVLEVAEDINDSGQIVGYGHIEGCVDFRAFLLTPIPEPSVLALVALGALGLLVRGRAK